MIAISPGCAGHAHRSQPRSMLILRVASTFSGNAARREQVGGGVVALRLDDHGFDLGRILVERGGQQGPPRRQPRPAQVMSPGV